MEDAPRSGRPPVQTDENVQAVLHKVRRDRYRRERSCTDLAGHLSQEGIQLFATTICRVLKKAEFRKTKLTRKPGLTKRMKEERLKWCSKQKDWTLED